VDTFPGKSHRFCNLRKVLESTTPVRLPMAP